jgi:predicted RNA-binding Zn-ribbon protein involved in translation (DUF1610 family)
MVMNGTLYKSRTIGLIFASVAALFLILGTFGSWSHFQIEEDQSKIAVDYKIHKMEFSQISGGTTTKMIATYGNTGDSQGDLQSAIIGSVFRSAFLFTLTAICMICVGVLLWTISAIGRDASAFYDFLAKTFVCIGIVFSVVSGIYIASEFPSTIESTGLYDDIINTTTEDALKANEKTPWNSFWGSYENTSGTPPETIKIRWSAGFAWYSTMISSIACGVAMIATKWAKPQAFAVIGEETYQRAVRPQRFAETYVPRKGGFTKAKCSACGTSFEVSTERPIEVTCPECGKSGVLN